MPEFISMSTTNCCMISRYIKIQFININHLSNIINYGCLPRRMRFIDENNIVLFTLFFLNKIFVFFLKNSFFFGLLSFFVKPNKRQQFSRYLVPYHSLIGKKVINYIIVSTAIQVEKKKYIPFCNYLYSYIAEKIVRNCPL